MQSQDDLGADNVSRRCRVSLLIDNSLPELRKLLKNNYISIEVVIKTTINHQHRTFFREFESVEAHVLRAEYDKFVNRPAMKKLDAFLNNIEVIEFEVSSN